ncbi:helix-turn-helix transcriptional regulator [Streptomyces sp. CC228A]|uniref:helix-turn-helix domain-containing protein n=1 Tax=Streptomyces sp. CC228A TaxID=2898186 RepID=UPI001F42589C|nr:helix-turn-helix transcriptional regulator [Streptomyces sp. CC228A]
MVPTSDDLASHRQRLGALATQRRIQLGITNKVVAAERCGFTVTTYTKIERGERVSATSYAKLEAGFGMRAGSCDAVLAGADSITLTDGTELVAGAQIDRSTEAAELSEELRRGNMDLVTMVSPHISGGEAQEISRRAAEYALEVLRRRGVLRGLD